MTSINSVVEMLEEISADQLTSKKLKLKIGEVIEILNNGNDLKIDKALHELEGVSSMEISSYNRTQLWDVVSMLESIH